MTNTSIIFQHILNRVAINSSKNPICARPGPRRTFALVLGGLIVIGWANAEVHAQNLSADDKSGKQINEPIQNTNQSHVDTDGNGPCASGRGFINNSCLPLPYILKEQVESGAMTVKEWRKEMDEWKEYWKTNPEEELHGCTDNNGFDTGLCVTLPKE